LSGQFSQRSLFAAVDAILGANFASRTHRNVMKQSTYNQIIKLVIINCGLTILIVSLISLCRFRNAAQLRSGTVDKSKWPVFLQTNLTTSGVTRALNQGGQSFVEGGLSVTVGGPIAKIRKKNSEIIVNHWMSYMSVLAEKRKHPEKRKKTTT